jgi:hypothetical protein
MDTSNAHTEQQYAYEETIRTRENHAQRDRTIGLVGFAVRFPLLLSFIIVQILPFFYFPFRSLIIFLD